MQRAHQAVENADKVLLAAVDEAIDRAIASAAEELNSLGMTRSPHEYFADAALRHLFMRLCGADPETYTGGDPEIAWKILYAGRSVARHWEREGSVPVVLRKRKERREDMEKDKAERQELAHSARNFAMTTAIRVLIDHARNSDPQINDKMFSVIDTRHARLENISQTDLDFTEKAKTFMSLLTAPPK